MQSQYRALHYSASRGKNASKKNVGIMAQNIVARFFSVHDV